MDFRRTYRVMVLWNAFSNHCILYAWYAFYCVIRPLLLLPTMVENLTEIKPWRSRLYKHKNGEKLGYLNIGTKWQLIFYNKVLKRCPPQWLTDLSWRPRRWIWGSFWSPLRPWWWSSSSKAPPCKSSPSLTSLQSEFYHFVLNNSSLCDDLFSRLRRVASLKGQPREWMSTKRGDLQNVFLGFCHLKIVFFALGNT